MVGSPFLTNRTHFLSEHFVNEIADFDVAVVGLFGQSRHKVSVDFYLVASAFEFGSC